jgi:hypothetical protein
MCPSIQLADIVLFTQYKALYGITNCALAFPRTSVIHLTGAQGALPQA